MYRLAIVIFGNVSSVVGCHFPTYNVYSLNASSLRVQDYSYSEDHRSSPVNLDPRETEEVYGGKSQSGKPEDVTTAVSDEAGIKELARIVAEREFSKNYSVSYTVVYPSTIPTDTKMN